MGYTTIKAKQSVFKEGVHYMTSPFGMRTINGKTSMHNGIDLIGKAYACDHIVAFADGTVTAMLNTCGGSTPSTGNYVTLDHGNGIQTVYYHMRKGSVTVNKGDTVKAGTVIGYMGTTGNSTGNHLHFGIKINGSWVDPRPYLEGSKTLSIAKNDKSNEKARFDIGDKVFVNGKIYAYGSGTGKSVTKNDATMYVCDIVDSKTYPHYIGVATIKGGKRQGWAKPDILSKSSSVTPTKTTEPNVNKTFAKGDAVIVNGTITGYGNGGGGSIAKNGVKMYVSDIENSKVYKNYIGLSAVKGGRRQGWANPNILTKA